MLTIAQTDLVAVLSAAVRIATSEAFPELRISAVNGRLTVSATDMEHWLDLTVDCSGELDPVCVHAKRFHDVAASIIGELIGIQLEGSALKIYAGKGRRSLATIPAKDWPERHFEATSSVTIEADRLRDCFGFTGPNVASFGDLTKQHMSGVHLATEGGKLKAFGSDAFNLTVVEIADCKDTFGATISPKSVETVSRLAKGGVQVNANASASEFRWEDGRIIGPLIMGDYPRELMGKAFAREYTSSVSVEAKELLRAIRSVRAVGFQDRLSRSTGIKLVLNGTASLQTEAPEGSAEQEFAADWQDGEQIIGFAAARMERLLGCFDDDVLTIGILEPTLPMKIEAAGKSDRMALLYPMRV